MVQSVRLSVRLSARLSVHLSVTPFYASAFRRRRHYVFGLSVRPSVCPSVHPSVRSLKYPLLTFTWVCWSTRPTVTILRHVRLSVRLSVRPSGEVSGHLPKNAWRKWPQILHSDVSWPLQNWLVYGHGLLIFLILALFWLSETGQIWGFRAFPGECMEEMTSNFARWCILTTSRTD